MRENLTQNIEQNLPNPIQKEDLSTKSKDSKSPEPNGLNKLLKQIKKPKILSLIFLLILSLLSLFINNDQNSNIKPEVTPTLLPLNQPTSIPQIPEKYSQKFDQLNQIINTSQIELPPQIDETVGIN